MSKRAFEGVQRRDVFFVDPDELVLITDPKHALFDARALEQPDEAMILNIMALGVLEPVLARMNDGTAEVVAGRRRVLACREANRRSKAAGGPGMCCPVMTRKGDDGLMALGMVAENEHRAADNPLARARKAQALSDIGLADEKIANAFGVDVATMKRWGRVLEAAPEVQRAVADEKIGIMSAAALSRLPHDEQRTKLREVLADGGKPRASTNEVKRAVNGGGAAPTRARPTAKQIRAACEAAKASDKAGFEAAMVLQWVVGEVNDAEARQHFSWLPESM